MTARLVPFATIAALGFAVQAVIIVLLQHSGVSVVLSTLLGVECALLHNFVWHERWTWRDRPGGRRIDRLIAFHATNGLTSMAGNVVIAELLSTVAHVGVVTRTLAAVLLTGLLNLTLADRFVFTPHAAPFQRERRRPTRRAAVAALIAAAILTASTAWAGPPAQALAEWSRLIATTEASIARAPHTMPSFDRQTVMAGGMDVRAVDARPDLDGATVQRWRGAILLPGVRLDAVLRSLTTTLPAQPDVTAARFVRNSGEQMAVYLRLVRRAGITVTYDTEHDVVVSRLSPGMAISRSIMTRVNEVRDAGQPTEHAVGPDEDRGFLWRLNAYWWYQETPAGVIAVMESLTLSRDIPLLLRPMAAPVVRHIARESVTSALQGLRARFNESS